MYTCNTCCLEFETSDLQRNHMKCDWHRYNLKRKVAQLPPVDETVFHDKMRQMTSNNQTKNNTSKTSTTDAQLSKKEQKKREKEALLEKKRQLLQMARQNILKAIEEQQKQSELNNVMTVEEPVPIENIIKGQQTEKAKKEEEEDLTPDQLAEKLMKEKIANKVEIPINVCLFCNHSQREKHLSVFKDMDANIDHMFKCHGFYIPEQKYLIDKEGLIKYMAEKIGLGNVCLVCSYQGKNLEAVRNHMLAKRHCRIPYETLNEKLEISEFYDFTSTYSDYAKKPNDKETFVTINANNIPNNGENNGDDEDEWEDISSDVEEREDGNEGEDEGDIPEEYLYNDGMALHLPTGIKVGHRSLHRYFNQSLKPEKILTEGQGTLVAADTRSFVTGFDKKVVQTQQRVWQSEVKDKKRNEKRSAKFINNQPHYRDQLLQ